MEKAQDRPIVVWDLETSGLDPKTSQILEIGAMVVDFKYEDPIRSRHQWVLNHGIKVPEEIVKITGITDEIIAKEGRDPKECLEEFLKIIGQAEWHLTHNGIRFDIPFLAESVQRILGKPLIDLAPEVLKESSMIDTAVMYKARKMKLVQNESETFKQFADRVMNIRVFGLKYNVGACCDDLGIDRTNVKQHRALADIELTFEIYKKLIG